MDYLYKCWLSKELESICDIKKIEEFMMGVDKCSNAYKDVFTGAPFYEAWTEQSAKEMITKYINEDALILGSQINNNIIGFLVAMNGVPENQKEFVPYNNDLIKYIEEIGVVLKYRNKQIASEMVRILLLRYFEDNIKYLAYRTNAMRYFELVGGESFEAGVIRVQKEDKIKRLNNEKIVIPDFNRDEKQDFINKYIELLNYMPELDVSNSNMLFRNIFGSIDFCRINGNYSFQIDPSANGNDRIFPIINLEEKEFSRERIK